MTEPQEYIITEDELSNIEDLLKRNAFFQSVIDEHLDPVWNRPAKESSDLLDELLEKMTEEYKKHKFDYDSFRYEGICDGILMAKRELRTKEMTR